MEKNLKNFTKTYQNLNNKWQLRSYAKDNWIDAKVPGNVHLDLLENKIIPDNSLVVGSPGKVIRKLTDEEIQAVEKNAIRYQDNWKKYSKSIR